MITIMKQIFLRYEGEKSVERMEICVDAASDLPTVNSITGCMIAQGIHRMGRVHRGFLRHDVYRRLDQPVRQCEHSPDPGADRRGLSRGGCVGKRGDGE